MAPGGDHGRSRGKLRRLIPWTSGGILLWAGAGGLVYWTFGFSHDHVIRVVGLCCLGLPIVSLAIVLGFRQKIRRQITANLEGALCCGDQLVSPSPPLEIRFVAPPADDAMRLLKRGAFADGIEFRLCDPFHLVDMESHIPGKVVVWPGRGTPSSEWESLQNCQAGEEWGPGGKPGEDMLEIGHYQLGDAAKNILWKINARTGCKAIYVRRPELTVSTKIAYYFVAGDGDDLAADYFDYLLRNHKTGDMDIYGFSTEPDQTVTDREKARDLLVMSGSPPKEKKNDIGGYDQFQQEIARNRVSGCVVMLPSTGVLDLKRRLGEPRVNTRYVACIGDGCVIPAEWDREGVQVIVMKPDNPQS